jgi:DNA transformation protein
MTWQESKAYAEELAEQLDSLGSIDVVRVFSGAGLRHAGLNFALTFRDVLYFRTDRADRTELETRGLKPFSYDGHRGHVVVGSYYEAPADVFDDEEAFLAASLKAIAAAEAAAKPKTRRRSKNRDDGVPDFDE